MKIEDNKITFELDEQTIQAFIAAVYLKQTNADDAFKDMVRDYIYNANREYLRNNEIRHGDYLNRSTIEMTTRTRDLRDSVNRWILRKSVYYYIIKAFFEIYDQKENHFVTIEELENASNKYLPDDGDQIVSRFRRNFRMICSNKAIGQVFVYNRTNNIVEISTEDGFDKFLLDKKEEFLRD